MALAPAAHNAARLPFVNVIGALQVLRVRMIRNGADPVAEGREDCVGPGADERVTAAQVTTPDAPRGCSALGAACRPVRPICRLRVTACVGLLGPALTAVNAVGIGAAGQLAEVRRADAVRRLRASLGGAAAQSASRPATVLDLLPDGVRDPLGWHLSALAVEGLWALARSCSQ